MSDDDGVTRRNAMYKMAAAGSIVAGSTLTGLETGEYIARKEDEINRKGAEPNYMGKNTNIESIDTPGGISVQITDVAPYPQQNLSGNAPSSLERIANNVLEGASDFALGNGILEQIPGMSTNVNPAPVDGGGQFQGNPASTGYTETYTETTTRQPVTGFGQRINVDDEVEANSPVVSQGGRTALVGSGNTHWYDQSGNKTSVDRGQSVPVFLNNGSEIVCADADGLVKFDADDGSVLDEASETGSQGAVKASDGIIAVESDGRADFFNASDLSPVSSVSNTGPAFLTLAFADSENAIYTDGKSVESVNAREGTKNWSVDPYGSSVASVGAATNGSEYATTTTDERVLVFDNRDGSEIADLDIGNARSVSSPVFDAEGGMYTLGDRLTKFNSDYEQEPVWSTSTNGLGNRTVAIDNVVVASTTNAVQMFDKESGELVDEALSSGKAKTMGMPRNGKVPVVEFDSDPSIYYELPLERSKPDPAQPPRTYLGDVDLRAEDNEIPAGGSTDLITRIPVSGDAPFPLQVGGEIRAGNDGERAIIDFSYVIQPGETEERSYGVTTELSERDNITGNESAFDADLNFENDSTPGKEIISANATMRNATAADQPQQLEPRQRMPFLG